MQRTGTVPGSGAVRYRISKGTGRLMVAFAFILDMLPIILAVVMLFAAFSGSVPPADTSTQSDVPWWNVYGHWENMEAKVDAWLVEFGERASNVFLAAAGVLILAPATYFIASFLAPILGFLIFLFWFLSKGVNPFSITGALLMLVEAVPFANLLPTITLVVWRTVRVSRKEDELRGNFMSA